MIKIWLGVFLVALLLISVLAFLPNNRWVRRALLGLALSVVIFSSYFFFSPYENCLRGLGYVDDFSLEEFVEEIVDEFADDQTDSEPTPTDASETPFTDAMGSLNTTSNANGRPFGDIKGVCDSRTWW
ncbi:MAG: hypothetical protein HOG18_05975 [Proteobacteria bacterium]|nr:hypothetical protein [Pseudomonadota bacterium]MBT5190109.1 hypothetical protein [Pseudomonadota bacterium]